MFDNSLSSLFSHMLSSLSIWNIRYLIMCSECHLHFSSHLCFVTKQEIEFFPCADIVSYFMLLLLVYDCSWMRWYPKSICSGSLCPRVRPERGFKNRNRIPDLPEHKSGSFYRNRNIFFCISVPVNPEPDFEFLLPVLAKPEPEIRFYRISGWNSPEKIFSEISFFLKVLS